MRHQKQGRKLNRTASHRKALMMNMASSLVLHKRIRTTDAKAKELRTIKQPIVTLAKKNDHHKRRMLIRNIQNNGYLCQFESALTVLEESDETCFGLHLGIRKFNVLPLTI